MTVAAGPAGVTRIITPAGDPMWLVTDFALGRAVLTDPRFSRAAACPAGAPRYLAAQPVPESLSSLDGPDHARLRRTVAGAFTTHKMAALAPVVERLTDQRLDVMSAAGPPADFVAEVAAHLPLTILCGLLGVPLADSAKFTDWVGVLFERDDGPESRYRRLELARYMTRLLAAKRGEPADDLLSSLVAEHDRGELSRAETHTLGLTLLMAGFASTVGQLSLMVLALLADPGAWAELGRRRDLVPQAVEEAMRLNPASLFSFPRVARETVRLGDVTVAAGEGVMVSLLHANRDAQVFAEPDEMRLDDRGPGHLSFGHGPHRCLGAPLATLQLRVTLHRLLERFPTLRLADVPEPYGWKEADGTRGLSRLMVAWDDPGDR